MTQPTQRTVLLQVRPRRIVFWAIGAAVLMVGSTTTVGILLQVSEDGIAFRAADQIALIGIGVLMAAAVLIAAARPRVQADADGLRIRNMVGHREVPWTLIHRISFPEGAQWPLLLLDDDETYPLVAVQAMDRERAVADLKKLRAIFDTFAVHRPEQSPEALAAQEAALLEAERSRPLGRLEVIDLQRARKKR